jgi:hypothetical protein
VSEAIEDLRCKMIEAAMEKGSLLDPSVLAISRQLDFLIIEEQRRRVIRAANSKWKVLSFWRSPVSSLKNMISI